VVRIFTWFGNYFTFLVSTSLLLPSVLIANTASEGLDNDGGLWHEFDTNEGRLVKEKHWWPQAEAMIEFFNAWQITSAEDCFKRSLKSCLIKRKFRNKCAFSS